MRKEKLTYKEAAARNNVKPTLVQAVMSASKRDESFLEKASERETQRRKKLRVVINDCYQRLGSADGLDRAEQVRQSVLASHDIKVSRQYVSSVLRHDIGARYKRLRKVPFLGNTDRCLILRAHFSKFLLGQLASGARIINLDQTWINDLNYTRRKWRSRGQAETCVESKVNPRVSL